MVVVPRSVSTLGVIEDNKVARSPVNDEARDTILVIL